ncbi:phosphoglycerate dehydrogenase [candidate division KSB1 bacterium]|nr:phosphoglycerate dehydrogenase [candidate division KSB1 bacterium]
MIQNVIFDFDSTMLTREVIDILIETALDKFSAEERQFRQDSLRSLNRRAEAGEISRGHKMNQQLLIAKTTRDDIKKATARLLQFLNASVKTTIRALMDQQKQIFVFSRGFDELILPVTDSLSLTRRNIFMNQLFYDDTGNVAGVDESNPLFLLNGKVYLAEHLQSEGRLIGTTAVVGNSVADISIRKSNIADYFIYYSANLQQEAVRREADYFTDSFQQILTLICTQPELAQKKPGKNKSRASAQSQAYRIALLENIHESAYRKLEESQFHVTNFRDSAEGKTLYTRAAASQIIGIRSKTRITATDLGHLRDLTAIGCFCIGTDQVDLAAAAEKGIPVFNAPYANTRSVAELVVGEAVMLMRHAFEKSMAMHQAKWVKGAEGCQEVRGKIIGIIGYGHIGSQVSILCENLGMRVIFYDIIDKLPLGNAKPVESLDELLRLADIVTLHVPDTPETQNMIAAAQFEQMKMGSILINTSRGQVVDLDALAHALRTGKCAGAAIDVFPREPGSGNAPFQSVLQNLPNVILTPHIGGSTEEAQAAIAQDVSNKIEKFLKTGTTLGAVNFPEAELAMTADSDRILHIHKNVPGVVAKINDTLSKHNIHIIAQILKTRGNIGYLIVDIRNDTYSQAAELLSHITETIKVRKI